MIRRPLVLAATLVSAGTTANVAAHQDDPKLWDRQPPVEAPAFRVDVDGELRFRSGGFESDGVSLLGWLPLNELGGYQTGNDCWGYVSESGTEYAIIGVNSATIIVSLAAPGNPQIVATIPGPDSLWRDVKTYQSYCYSVSEGGSGIQVIDLSDIDNGNAPLVNTVTTGGTTATHNVAINTQSGFLYRLGGDSNGMRIYSLADPTTPELVGSYTNKYVHDAQIVSYIAGPYAGREIAFCCAGFNGGFDQTGLTIVDVTNKNNIFEISSLQYGNGSYSHQGWLTQDRTYFFLNDELDESDNGTPTTTRIINVADLNNPFEVGTCSTGLAAIDHNLYINGDRMYQANYRSGLQIFDISDPLKPVRTAFFDTYPGSDSAQFNGMWSVYPFFPSGTLMCSDLERGLFILQSAQISLALQSDLPTTLSPAGATISVRIAGVGNGQADPASFQLTVNDGSGDRLSSLLATSDPEVWVASFPNLQCGNQASWFISASSVNGQTLTLPSGGNRYDTLVADAVVESFAENFQSDSGWTIDAGATEGNWQRATPANGGNRCDNPTDGDGSGLCFVTGNGANEDVDGGTTTLTSPPIPCPAGSTLSYFRWYNNGSTCNGADPQNDVMEVDLSTDGGTTWTILETVGPVAESSGGWFQPSFVIANSPAGSIRLRFRVGDLNAGSIIEAAVDGISVNSIECDDVTDCAADCANGDGAVEIADVLQILADFGNPGICDLDGNGIVNVDDLLTVIASFGPCP